jgi:hypothetical protein
MNHFDCSKQGCGKQVMTEPDFSKPAQRYDRWVNNELRFVVAHPHKELERPAYCYYHKHFRNMEAKVQVSKRASY